MFGHFSFSRLARPDNVPPVPAPATIMSIFPGIQKIINLIINDKYLYRKMLVHKNNSNTS